MCRGRGLFKESLMGNNSLGVLCRKVVNNRCITKKQKRRIVGIYNYMPQEERYSFINRIVKSIEYGPSPRKAVKKFIRTYSATLAMTYPKVDSCHGCHGCDCCNCKK